MKKCLLSLFVVFLLPLTALHAQEQLEIKASCSYDGELPEETIWSFASDDQAKTAVTNIMRYTGLPQNFDIMAANVPNAAAVIRGSRRLILYNQGFMIRVASSTGTDWAAVSIMAHEIGHHLSGHTLEDGGSRPKIELEADRFSGYVLHRMGAGLEESLIAIRTLTDDTPSDTHPPRTARLAAIENGWIDASDQAGTITSERTTPTASDLGRQTTAADECPAPRSGTSPIELTYNGSLAANDEKLDNGEFYDYCTIEMQAGEHLVADLRSDNFDTHLMVVSPSGEFTQNDDYNNATNRSRVEMDIAESGRWVVAVTSYAAGETGPYRVMLATAAGAQTQAGGTVSGALASGDDTLNDGEYYDVYAMTVRAGQRVEADLTASGFDPYIVLISPSGERTWNDDFEGARDRSRVELTADEGGEWRVLVTSYGASETGSYTLKTVPALGGATPAAPAAPRALTGTLSAGDPTLTNGEHYDAYYLDVNAGQEVHIELTSSDFDTYIFVSSASGQAFENDDHQGAKNRSVLTFTAPDSGPYRILATSYGGGEKGSYSMTVTPTASATPSPNRTYNGTLSSSDRTLNAGEYYDIYFVPMQSGQTLTVDLTSSNFDTYLVATAPDGKKTNNDDYENANSRSQVVVKANEDGVWLITATSYKGGETGAYQIGIQVR